MKKLYILDADVIIHLAELNKLDSLFNQHEIYLSPVVFNEIKYIIVKMGTKNGDGGRKSRKIAKETNIIRFNNFHGLLCQNFKILV